MRNFQKLRRKLLFPVGLLSLAIVPLMLFASLYSLLFPKPTGILMVTYWSPADSVRWPSPLKLVNGKFTRITLNGSKDDKVKLAFAQIAIRELVNQSDTTLGIEFIFSKTAKYSSLVRLFDICQHEEVPSYVNYQDKFFVFNVYPKNKMRTRPLVYI